MQNYFYDLHDQLVKAEIFKKDGTKETWSYTYDALGRRIGKGRLKDGEVSGSLENQTRFVWDGSHLLQEIHLDGRYTYIYTDPDSYEPLAQIRDWTTKDGKKRQQTHYFHCEQIGIPREMTDKDGNLLWFGNYTGWGRLKEETRVTGTAHQPFRLQNQYCDRETGLHYNFFRYYEPDAGRFVNQDPIGLMGGDNFYHFAPNILKWIDALGWSRWTKTEVLGRRVYKNDTLFTPTRKVSWKDATSPTGYKCGTNLDRMCEGMAPIGKDGKSVELHHLTQQEVLRNGKRGSLAEVSWTIHTKYTAILHIPFPRNPNKRSQTLPRFPSFRRNNDGTPSTLAAEFDNYRSAYWKERAKDFGRTCD